MTIAREDQPGRLDLMLRALRSRNYRMMPLGSLLAGTLASSRIGAPGTVAISGIWCILAGGWFALRLPELREAVRPIYREQGILPELAEGLRTAQVEDSKKSIAG